MEVFVLRLSQPKIVVYKNVCLLCVLLLSWSLCGPKTNAKSIGHISFSAKLVFKARIDAQKFFWTISNFSISCNAFIWSIGLRAPYQNQFSRCTLPWYCNSNSDIKTMGTVQRLRQERCERKEMLLILFLLNTAQPQPLVTTVVPKTAGLVSCCLSQDLDALMW